MKKRLVIHAILSAAAALVFWGCSSSSAGAPQVNPATGTHPAGWVQAHWPEYLKNPGSCTACHGSTTDSAAAGGTSKVSCFTCHPKGPNHPVGFADHAQHGRLGAQAPYDSTPFSMKGMASCTVCHGADYRTGIGTTRSCFSCHTKAPHPDAPWGATATPPDPTQASTHDHTDPTNAPACFVCHAAGSVNNTIQPVTPAEAGTVPGCFNNTMCHGTSVH